MKNIITKYLENTITDNEKQQLLDWLNESETNQKEFNDFSEIWLLADANNSDPALLSVALNRYKDNISKESQKSNRRRSLYLWQRVAATVAVIFLSTAIGYFAGRHFTATSPQPIMTQYVTGDDSKSSVKLPDGTVVWLNANSTLKYPETFSSTERLVELEGEAFFDVVENKTHPFKVATNDFRITVLGTTFNVRSRCFDETSQAVLLSGKVLIDDYKGHEFHLRPNQKITYDKLSKGYVTSDVLAENYTLWKENQLYFENEKLSDILDKLSYWYGMEIDYSSDIAKDTRLSLLIKRESKEEIFKLLDLIAPIKSSIDNYTGNVRITKK